MGALLAARSLASAARANLSARAAPSRRAQNLLPLRYCLLRRPDHSRRRGDDAPAHGAKEIGALAIGARQAGCVVEAAKIKTFHRGGGLCRLYRLTASRILRRSSSRVCTDLVSRMTNCRAFWKNAEATGVFVYRTLGDNRVVMMS